MEVGEAMNDSKQALELGDIPMVFLLLGVPFCTEILVRYFSDLDLVNPEVGRVIRLPIFACAIFVFLKIIDCLDRRIQERHCFKVQQDIGLSKQMRKRYRDLRFRDWPDVVAIGTILFLHGFSVYNAVLSESGSGGRRSWWVVAALLFVPFLHIVLKVESTTSLDSEPEGSGGR